MNNEIKEIKINKMAKSITFINNEIAFSQFGIADEILDLITNLQQEIDKLTAESTEWESKCYDLQRNYDRIYNENCKLREEHNITDISLLDENYKLKQENEELNRMCELYGKSLYYAELKDYKSRCKKASEKIKKIRENAIKYGADHDAVVCNDLLNILQNGSDSE